VIGRTASRLSGLLALLLAPTVSQAQVRQPDGTVIPTLTSSDGPSVGDILTTRAETNLHPPLAPFDAQANARPDPQTFRPGCRISFRVVARYAGHTSAFGWYNVDPARAAPPPEAERYEIVPDGGMTSPPAAGGIGFVGTLDIGTDPRYRGGAVGFFLHNTVQGHFVYTERRYQPPDVPGFVYALIYDSRVTPNAFYFAWEDALSGNDNDFNDLIVLVDNLTCAGGGAACVVPGAIGVCAAGTQQCRNAELMCVATSAPSPERCDGVDNNCDGQTDEGDGLCPPREVCDRGVCVERCTAELGCLGGLVCSDRGTCVESACATLTCPAGAICRGGACRAPCEGVVCPHGQACRQDRCVDPCAGLRCDAAEVCVAGICQTRCPCHRCAASESCLTDGVCHPSSCASVTCPAGNYCDEGRCVDACANAVCPAHATCRAGACVAPAADAGVSADVPSAPDVGTTDSSVGDGSPGPRPPFDAGVIRDVALVYDRPDGGAAEFTGKVSPGAPSGCGCRVGGTRRRASSLAALAGLALFARSRRRRRAPRAR
jgi:hypothetical protein